MSIIRKQVKRLLRSVGLYKATRQLWGRLPNFRILSWNAGYRLAGTPDRLPIPPSRFINLITGTKEVSLFLTSGKIGRNSILYVLARNKLKMENFRDVLDFGCGCGRVMRHWKSLKGPRLYGCDYNLELIHWCQRNLGDFAEFRTNNLTPPLEYKDESFDFIYAISVFTHLTEKLQHDWIAEMVRILRPGGVFLITIHGESQLYKLKSEERKRFLDGKLVVRKAAVAGSNACSAYHPESYVRSKLARWLKVLDFVPRGARDADQDVFLLRK